MTAKLRFLFAVFLTLATSGRAVLFGAALFGAHESVKGRVTLASASVPRPVSFREVSGRGLLIRTWINSQGPFTFAIDTGAGATLLSQRVAEEAGANVSGGRTISVAGLSGAPPTAPPRSIRKLPTRGPQEFLPAQDDGTVTNRLP